MKKICQGDTIFFSACKDCSFSKFDWSPLYTFPTKNCSTTSSTTTSPISLHKTLDLVTFELPILPLLPDTQHLFSCLLLEAPFFFLKALTFCNSCWVTYLFYALKRGLSSLCNTATFTSEALYPLKSLARNLITSFRTS